MFDAFQKSMNQAEVRRHVGHRTVIDKVCLLRKEIKHLTALITAREKEPKFSAFRCLFILLTCNHHLTAAKGMLKALFLCLTLRRVESLGNLLSNTFIVLAGLRIENNILAELSYKLPSIAEFIASPPLLNMNSTAVPWQDNIVLLDSKRIEASLHKGIFCGTNAGHTFLSLPLLAMLCLLRPTIAQNRSTCRLALARYDASAPSTGTLRAAVVFVDFSDYLAKRAQRKIFTTTLLLYAKYHFDAINIVAETVNFPGTNVLYVLPAKGAMGISSRQLRWCPVKATDGTVIGNANTMSLLDLYPYMGGTTWATPRLSCVGKWHLRWDEDAQVDCVEAAENTTHRISPVEVKAGATKLVMGYIRMLVGLGPWFIRIMGILTAGLGHFVIDSTSNSGGEGETITLSKSIAVTRSFWLFYGSDFEAEQYLNSGLCPHDIVRISSTVAHRDLPTYAVSLFGQAQLPYPFLFSLWLDQLLEHGGLGSAFRKDDNFSGPLVKLLRRRFLIVPARESTPRSLSLDTIYGNERSSSWQFALQLLSSILYVATSNSSTASALGQGDLAPQPRVANITYWGSACPEGGLRAVIGPVDATKNIAPLTFTLANFLPALGSFGSSLRMCNIVSRIIVDNGWKIMVNARGTNAQGNTNLPGNATMFLRSTYSFAEKAELQVNTESHQSIGMLDVKGPLTGQFARRLTPVDGDQGIVGPCTGGELDIEFQARAVEDSISKMLQQRAPNETSWTLTTDMDISRLRDALVNSPTCIQDGLHEVAKTLSIGQTAWIDLRLLNKTVHIYESRCLLLTSYWGCLNVASCNGTNLILTSDIFSSGMNECYYILGRVELSLLCKRKSMRERPLAQPHSHLSSTSHLLPYTHFSCKRLFGCNPGRENGAVVGSVFQAKNFIYERCCRFAEAPGTSFVEFIRKGRYICTIIWRKYQTCQQASFWRFRGPKLDLIDYLFGLRFSLTVNLTCLLASLENTVLKSVSSRKIVYLLFGFRRVSPRVTLWGCDRMTKRSLRLAQKLTLLRSNHLNGLIEPEVKYPWDSEGPHADTSIIFMLLITFYDVLQHL
ncbi:uncharacterized protein BDR25DRAFT_349146 [Lindgomyces ingoldianus]|uniref:Uncharacterized protein n=1 Tax=Lindgomyces ingoldianus TaxID=673940 RepID=A0ACB6RDM2_9PLEO|nr:uncharacterized protein BDR25DRAFT_349146 [Lindgomyces ingoldianus]KAF2477212.1 hypothetical protein BDR25DRAFT_349146 [Lindgomyces ingoldianus]